MLLLLAALTVTTQPALLRLGSDVRALVHVECAGEPALSASVGRIEKVRRAGSGWEADYLAPDEPVPQVAILTAVAAGQFGWVALPLWGEGDAVVKTRPRASIKVRIGSEEFGPAVADAQGEALVPVVVPPGVNEAFHGKRAIDLHVPPTRALQLAAAFARARADRETKLPLFVAAVTPQGQPLPGQPAISLSASRGQLSALAEAAPGTWQATLTVPAGAAGEVRVAAELGGFTSEIALQLEPGPAAAVELRAASDRAVAGQAIPPLHALARDAAGNPSAEELQFSATLGAVQAQRAAPGEWTVTLSLPGAFQGARSVEVTARAAAARASATLQLVPAEAAQIALRGAPSLKVRADGRSAVRLPLELRDAYGNPASEVPQIAAGQGVARVEAQGGALYATYLPPRLQESSATQLDLRSGKARTSAPVTLLPRLKPAAVSPTLGLMSNFSGFTEPFFGVEAAVRSEALGPQLGLALELDYTARSHDEDLSALQPLLTGSSRLTLFLAHLSAAWRLEVTEHATAWISGGPSLAALWTRVNLNGGTVQRGSALAPGLQVAIGAERRLRLVVPFVELRAGWITQPGLSEVGGPLRTLSLMGGARLELL